MRRSTRCQVGRPPGARLLAWRLLRRRRRAGHSWPAGKQRLGWSARSGTTPGAAARRAGVRAGFHAAGGRCATSCGGWTAGPHGVVSINTSTWRKSPTASSRRGGRTVGQHAIGDCQRRRADIRLSARDGRALMGGPGRAGIGCPDGRRGRRRRGIRGVADSRPAVTELVTAGLAITASLRRAARGSAYRISWKDTMKSAGVLTVAGGVKVRIRAGRAGAGGRRMVVVMLVVTVCPRRASAATSPGYVGARGAVMSAS